MHTIHIPTRLTAATVIPFSLEFNKYPTCPENRLDFSHLGHVEPFGMLFLAALIRQFRRKGKEAYGSKFRLAAINYEGHSYAQLMGFYNSFGMRLGKLPGEAAGSSTYIPLSWIRVNKVKSEAREGYVHHGEIIEQESSRIADILTRFSECDVADTLRFAIREIMRNVIEHGEGASHIWYAAQHWPTKKKVEIAILDEGVGLYTSLKRNSKLPIPDNKQALFMSLQPGISGVAKDRRDRRDGVWMNSGYGLFMTSSLCQAGGSFFICSGEDGISLKGKQSAFLQSRYSGVAIRMVLDTSRIESLSPTLAKIREIGEKAAAELNCPGTELSASKMSQMLSREM